MFSIAEGLEGVVGVVGSTSFSVAGAGAGAATVASFDEFLRAFAMAVEFAIAFFSVSDGEL